MIFVFVLTSFFIDAFDVTVMTCDAPWLDAERFEKVIGAEMGELSADERQGLILTVDRCTEATVRIRASNSHGQSERVIEIGEIPEEARPRTIALALSELISEASAVNAPEAPPPGVPPHEKETPTHFPDEEMQGETNTGDDAVTSPPPSLPPGHRESEDLKLAAGLYLRGFPLARTLAPEGRVGVRYDKWRADLGGYAMGWSSALGTAYLTAVTLSAGRSLWQRQGRMMLGLDVLLELGAVIAYGKADESSDYSPKFNVAAGGHLACWLAPGWRRRFRPLVAVEVGWLRGLVVFSGEKFQGGFEGLSTTIGVAGVW